MNLEKIRDMVENHRIQDSEDGRKTFYLFFENYLWCGEFFYLQEYHSQIIHFCDINGIEYAHQRKQKLVVLARRGACHFPLFDEFIQRIKPYRPVNYRERSLMHEPF